MKSSRDIDEDVDVKYAKALLITTDAIANARDGEEKVDLVEDMCKLNDIRPVDVWPTLERLVGELRYVSSSGISSRWTSSDGGFRDVLDGAFAMRCERVQGDVKTRVRGNFKCTVCGQLENSCDYVLHFAGTAPVNRGQNRVKYSAAKFQTIDPESLSEAYSTYASSYNSASTIVCEDSENFWPAEAYLGLVAPGKTCMQHIFTAFVAKDLIRSTIDDAFVKKASRSRGARLQSARVDALASKICQLRHSAAGRIGASFSNSDDDFWTELLERFTDAECQDGSDDYERLLGGYRRMGQNIDKTGYNVDDIEDDEEDGDEEAGPSSRAQSTRKRVIEESSSEEEEEEEDDVEDEDYGIDDDDDDEDEDYQSDDRTFPRPPPARWGSTAASKAGPFAKRRHACEEPHVSAHTRASRRRDPQQTHVDNETDAISVALRTVDKHTASKLRTHPGNVIGSRRSTVKKLAVMGIKLLEDGDLAVASKVLQGLSKLTVTLETHERGSGLSDYAKSTMFKEVVHDCLTSARTTLLSQGYKDYAKEIAEAIIVAHELLA